MPLSKGKHVNFDIAKETVSLERCGFAQELFSGEIVPPSPSCSVWVGVSEEGTNE